MTIEDPETLERAWVLELAYSRATGLDRLVHVAFDNDRSEPADGLFTIIPPPRWIRRIDARIGILNAIWAVSERWWTRVRRRGR